MVEEIKKLLFKLWHDNWWLLLDKFFSENQWRIAKITVASQVIQADLKAGDKETGGAKGISNIKEKARK